MTPTEKAIRDFCGHRADWWPSTTQVQEMLALAQPAQEPVAWLNKEKNTIIWDKIYPDMQPLYTTPPQRTWVSLTDEEIWTVLQFRGYNTDTIEIAKAIEAKLKEKNA